MNDERTDDAGMITFPSKSICDGCGKEVTSSLITNSVIGPVPPDGVMVRAWGDLVHIHGAWITTPDQQTVRAAIRRLYQRTWRRRLRWLRGVIRMGR